MEELTRMSTKRLKRMSCKSWQRKRKLLEKQTQLLYNFFVPDIDLYTQRSVTFLLYSQYLSSDCMHLIIDKNPWIGGESVIVCKSSLCD